MWLVHNFTVLCFSGISPVTVTVTVTEALELRPYWRPRVQHRVNPYLGARRQNETKMFSDHGPRLFLDYTLMTSVTSSHHLHFDVICLLTTCRASAVERLVKLL